MDFFSHLWLYLSGLLSAGELDAFILKFFLFSLLIEIPLYLIIVFAVMYKYLQETLMAKRSFGYYPKVSCIVVCYNEGRDIVQTIRSLEQQYYRGVIEIVVAVDDAQTNTHTLQAAKQYAKSFNHSPKRVLKIIEKKTRGGHASSMNLWKLYCTGEIIINLDGDSSCDNDMISNAVQEFHSEEVVACSGTLKARNADQNLLTKLQGLEYILGIHLTRVGLGVMNMVNNLSGAFGIYRAGFLKKTSGWRNGSAEDLDLTLRIKAYFKRHKNMRVVHSPNSIVYTDVPSTIISLFKQRMRWDGDLYYIYVSRHRKKISPRFMGWRNFIFTLWSGLLMSVVLPFVIVASLMYSLLTLNLYVFLGVLILVYLYYLAITLILYLVYWVFISERKLYDVSYLLVVPLLPIYNICLKFVTAIAIFTEILIRSHRDSTMAPSWVNKKSR